MAAIDEGDKLRNISDGAKGGANAHIQNHKVRRPLPSWTGRRALRWLP